MSPSPASRSVAVNPKVALEELSFNSHLDEKSTSWMDRRASEVTIKEAFLSRAKQLFSDLDQQSMSKDPELIREYFFRPWRSVQRGNTTNQSRPIREFRSRLIQGDDIYIDLWAQSDNEALLVKLTNNYGVVEADLVFTPTVNREKWTTIIENGLTVALPFQFTDSQLCFAMSTMWATRAKFAEILAKGEVSRSSGSTKAGSTKGKSGDRTQRNAKCDPKEKIHHLSHDLECTIPEEVVYLLAAGGIAIPRSGKFRVYVPTLGMEHVDVSACCKEHDIALWCANHRHHEAFFLVKSAFEADVSVIACFFSQIYEAYARGGFLEDIVNIAWFLIFDGWVAILAMIGANFSPFAHNEELLNLDHRNDDSCLCSGSNPTVLCDDSCRDLCKEFGKKQNCTSACTYDCRYDSHGRALPESPLPESQRRLVNKTNQPCCPTDVRPCKEPNPCATQNCNDCRWYCQPCRVWWKDPNCVGGYTAVYGNEYPGRDYRHPDKCCPERTSPNGVGSQPRADKIKCGVPPSAEARDWPSVFYRPKLSVLFPP